MSRAGFIKEPSVKSKFGVGLAVIACFAAWGGGVAQGDPVSGQLVKGSGGKAKHLAIGLPKTLFRGVPDGALKLANKPFQSLILDQTGLTGNVTNPTDAMEMAKQLDDRELQLGVFHGFEFAWAQTRYPNLEPLVVAVPNVRQTQVYLVVAAKSDVASPGDLKDKNIGLAAESKDHVLVYWDRLLETEIGGRGKCQVRKCVSAKESLYDVVDNLIQATLVDSASFLSFAAECPGAAKKLKILQKSEVFPPAVIAYRKDNLDAETLKRCRDGLNGASRNPKATFMLNLVRLEGFDITPKNYDAQLKKSLELYPDSAIERISFEKLIDK